MATKVKEIPQASLSERPCNVEKGGCCSSHRKADRIYEDQVWRYMQEPLDHEPATDYLWSICT